MAAEEKFETNLMRLIAAELLFLAGMQAGREMFGKGYFSLGPAEKLIVDQTVQVSIAGNYQRLTPGLLKTQATPQSVGFQFPGETPKP